MTRRLGAGLVVTLVTAALVSSSRAAEVRTPTYADPAWSPDGKRIAFVDIDPGDLFVMNADGTGARRLTRSRADHRDDRYGARMPDWAPDGHAIVFGYGYDAIDVIRPDGTGLRRIAHGSAPDWSPGGKRIAFQSGNESSGDSIYVVKPNGKDRRLVAAPSELLSYGGPAWSPDGERMVFDIGSAPDFGRPRWSPDGKRIAYALVGGIWVMKADGSGAHELIGS